MVPRETREVVRYLTLTPGTGVGPGPTDIDARRPSSPPAPSTDAGWRASRYDASAAATAGRRRSGGRLGVYGARRRQRGGAVAEQRSASLSAGPAVEACRGHGGRAVRRRHDRLRRHDLVRGDPLDESGVHSLGARCAAVHALFPGEDRLAQSASARRAALHLPHRPQRLAAEQSPSGRPPPASFRAPSRA